MSKIQDITDAIVTALGTITTIVSNGKVVTAPDLFNKYNEDQVLYVQTSVTDTDRAYYVDDSDSTTANMESEMVVEIDGAIYNMEDGEAEDDTFALMDEVDKKIFSTSAIQSLVCDIIPSAKDWVIEAVEKSALFTITYTANYEFNERNP